MNFNTNNEVRIESGLLGIASVPDSMIENYTNQAHGIVLTYISSVYVVTLIDATNPLFPGSPAEQHLKRAEALLASGYLLKKLYGGVEDSDKDGEEVYDMGIDLLVAISEGKPPIRLMDNTGTEFERIDGNQAGQGRGLVATGVSNDPKFSVNDEY